MSQADISNRSLDLYGGQDPREMPAYTYRDASRYLDIPLATLRSWILGRRYPTKSGERFFKPLFYLPDKDKPLLSFINLVEAHVLNAIRKDYKIDLQKVRRALLFLQRQFNFRHPLAEQRFETNGVDLFIHSYGQLINVSQDGQLGMKAILEKYLSRIEHDPSGRAARLYPFLRAEGHRESKSVVIDPYISFGQPVIAGTGIPTSVIAGRFNTGESVTDLANDYGRQTFEIEEAIRYERAA
jgi:uncharacterized protein (DUF433 family)